jgi:hypothetical protein
LNIEQPKQNHGSTRELQKESLEAAAGKTGERRKRKEGGQRTHGKRKHRQRPGHGAPLGKDVKLETLGVKPQGKKKVKAPSTNALPLVFRSV